MAGVSVGSSSVGEEGGTRVVIGAGGGSGAGLSPPLEPPELEQVPL